MLKRKSEPHKTVFGVLISTLIWLLIPFTSLAQVVVICIPGASGSCSDCSCVGGSGGSNAIDDFRGVYIDDAFLNSIGSSESNTDFDTTIIENWQTGIEGLLKDAISGTAEPWFSLGEDTSPSPDITTSLGNLASDFGEPFPGSEAIEQAPKSEIVLALKASSTLPPKADPEKFTNIILEALKNDAVNSLLGGGFLIPLPSEAGYLWSYEGKAYVLSQEAYEGVLARGIGYLTSGETAGAIVFSKNKQNGSWQVASADALQTLEPSYEELPVIGTHRAINFDMAEQDFEIAVSTLHSYGFKIDDIPDDQRQQTLKNLAYEFNKSAASLPGFLRTKFEESIRADFRYITGQQTAFETVAQIGAKLSVSLAGDAAFTAVVEGGKAGLNVVPQPIKVAVQNSVKLGTTYVGTASIRALAQIIYPGEGDLGTQKLKQELQTLSDGITEKAVNGAVAYSEFLEKHPRLAANAEVVAVVTDVLSGGSSKAGKEALEKSAEVAVEKAKRKALTDIEIGELGKLDEASRARQTSNAVSRSSTSATNTPLQTPVSSTTAKTPNEVFHYTTANWTKSIKTDGLRTGSYATPDGTLSPLQASIELSLPPNRSLPNVKLRIDLNAMRRDGYKIPEPTRVPNVVRGSDGRVYSRPGGGYEIQFDYEIPPKYISIVE